MRLPLSPNEVRGGNLSAYAVFAAMLSAAGLPIYIHAPKYFVDEYGVSLVALGTVLFGLRLLDVVQDPLFGRWSVHLGSRRGLAVSTVCVILTIGMLGLFAVPPLLPPLAWFALMLTMVFSAFSFLSINFYAQGVVKAFSLGRYRHLRLARWRETGALFGVCAAAISPFVLMYLIDVPFVGFAIGFAVLSFFASTMMQAEWSDVGSSTSASFKTVLRDPIARRLLAIAFVNAAPVAVSLTLFLFFIETWLMASEMEGPSLLLFFLSAALSVPIWGKSAERFGSKNTLMISMTLAIVAFRFAIFLGAGDWLIFAVVCAASGAALGADLTLLPAMFAKRMGEISPSATEGFGLWSFMSKFTLAFAAVLLLPVLQWADFVSGSADNSAQALTVLTLMYAALPCVLKIFALILLAFTAVNE